MPPRKIVLLACGSFNPPTNMHLRMFEIARDHLHRMGTHTVVGGFISPVHDAYAKNDLESATHRKEMVRLALRSSDWVKLSEWECNKESWSRTKEVLDYHQNHVNDILDNSINDNNSNFDEERNWSPMIKNGTVETIGVKLLCGADLLESFGTPGLWSDEDIEEIVGKYGLVVITRSKTNPLEFIYNSDMLTKYMSNISIVTEWIGNEVSSTKIRRALRRSESVKYLIPDLVIDYIQKKGLYGCKLDKYNSNIIFNMISENRTTEVVLTSPTTLSNCMNICNNNLFNRFQSNNDFASIDTVDMSKKNPATVSIANYKHPGQAVKVKTERKTVNRTNLEKVGDTSNVAKNTGAIPRLRSTKSSDNFLACEKVTKNSTSHKSEDNLKDGKSSRENLIKFIFTEHGVEVISDFETIV